MRSISKRTIKRLQKSGRLAHQPFSALVASETTSCVYPRVNQNRNIYRPHSRVCGLTMVSRERRDDSALWKPRFIPEVSG